jgi:hypothetical protein
MSFKNQQGRSVQRRWIFGGVLVGLSVAIGLRAWPSMSGPLRDPVRLRAWSKVEPRLSDADANESAIVEQQLQTIREFFADRQQGVTAFVEDALSLGGKWVWLKGAVSFDDGAGHRKYLRERFEQYVFRGDELRAVLAGAVTGTLGQLTELQNQLLMQIRADLSDSELLADTKLPELQRDEAFFRAYENAAKQVLSVMAREMGVTVGREVVAWVAADIATQVIARLGVSAGILGAGAASGVATLGIGAGAAVLVDLALDWVLKQIGHDPIGEVSRKVSESLNQTRDFLTDGTPAAVRAYARLRYLECNDLFPAVRAACGKAANQVELGGQLGLRHELKKLCESQSRVRREALRKLILVEGGLQ